MRSTPVARWLHHIIPAAAVGLALSLPYAAEARGGGGGGGMGGFHGGGIAAFHGGFIRGGIVAPRLAVGLFGPRIGRAHRVGRGGALRFGTVALVPRGGRVTQRFSTMGIPPFGGVIVPPLTGTLVPPLIGPVVPSFGNVAAPLAFQSGLHVVEIWQRQDGVWHHQFAVPSAAIWRAQDGRWHAEAAD